MTTTAIQKGDYTYRPQILLVGDVVMYHGRIFTLHRVRTTPWGPLYDLKRPYYIRGPRGGRTQKWTYASTYNRNGELS